MLAPNATAIRQRVFSRLLRGEATAAEYVAALKADIRARDDARCGIKRIP